MPKISVCMATRNGERFLRQQLDSILTQLGPEDELIISDDSSQDKTVEIIRSYTDHRIRLSENNTFYSPAFNFEHAFSLATGDIIVPTDQDDVWLDNKLAVVRRFFRDRGTRRQMVILDGCVVDEDERILHESILNRINAKNGLIRNIYNNTYIGCCMALSRDLLEIALPFPRRIPMHDMWLGLLAELFGTVEFVREPTMKYRRHGSTMTGFRIEFQPVRQILRRLYLVTALVRRTVRIAATG